MSTPEQYTPTLFNWGGTISVDIDNYLGEPPQLINQGLLIRDWHYIGFGSKTCCLMSPKVNSKQMDVHPTKTWYHRFWSIPIDKTKIGMRSLYRRHLLWHFWLFRYSRQCCLFFWVQGSVGCSLPDISHSDIRWYKPVWLSPRSYWSAAEIATVHNCSMCRWIGQKKEPSICVHFFGTFV